MSQWEVNLKTYSSKGLEPTFKNVVSILEMIGLYYPIEGECSKANRPKDQEFIKGEERRP